MITKPPRIAIVYDRVNTFGGAERVLQSLHHLYPDAPLYTAVYDKQGASWTLGWDVLPSYLQHVPFAKQHHEWFALFMQSAFETLDLSDFDIIISVTSEMAKAVITRADQLHVCYCLTPTRYLWSHAGFYAGSRLRFLRSLAFSMLRFNDAIVATRPDVYIAISTYVQKRIEKYYRRPVQKVLAPPVAVGNDVSESVREGMLIVCRLVPYKCVDHAIIACMELGVPLTIVGAGSDERRLMRLAGRHPAITFIGTCSDEDLHTLYNRSFAFLSPQEEDFGIAAIEAMAHGLPVISYRRGGVAENVTKETGVLYDEHSADGLRQAIGQARERKWDRLTISSHVRRFETVRFEREFHDTLSDLWVEFESSHTLQ